MSMKRTENKLHSLQFYKQKAQDQIYKKTFYER